MPVRYPETVGGSGRRINDYFRPSFIHRVGSWLVDHIILIRNSALTHQATGSFFRQGKFGEYIAHHHVVAAIGPALKILFDAQLPCPVDVGMFSKAHLDL